MSSFLIPTDDQIRIATANPLMAWAIPQLTKLNNCVLMGSVVLDFFSIRRPIDVDVLVSAGDWSYLAEQYPSKIFRPQSNFGHGIALEDDGKRMELFSVWQYVDNKLLFTHAIPISTCWGEIRIAPLELVYQYKVQASLVPGGKKHWNDCVSLATYFHSRGKAVRLL